MVSRSGALCFTQQGDMHADEIGFAQGLFKSHVLDRGLFLRESTRMPEIENFLDAPHKRMILIGRVIAEYVHVETNAFLDKREADAPGADHSHSFSRDFVAEKRQIRMPESPLVFAGQMLGRPHLARQHAEHEEGEFCGRFGQDLRRVGEGNLEAIRIGAIDVVEPDGVLSNDLEGPLAGGKDLGVDGIAQGRDQTVDAGFDFLYDQRLWWRLGMRINLDVISALPEHLDGITDITRGKHTECVAHDFSNRLVRDLPATSHVERESVPYHTAIADERVPCRGAMS